MKEIAYTTLGRNTLFVGLISHVAAILVTMMNVSGGELFFNIIFPFLLFAVIHSRYDPYFKKGSHGLGLVPTPALYLIRSRLSTQRKIW